MGAAPWAVSTVSCCEYACVVKMLFTSMEPSVCSLFQCLPLLEEAEQRSERGKGVGGRLCRPRCSACEGGSFSTPQARCQCWPPSRSLLGPSGLFHWGVGRKSATAFSSIFPGLK